MTTPNTDNQGMAIPFEITDEPTFRAAFKLEFDMSEPEIDRYVRNAKFAYSFEEDTEPKWGEHYYYVRPLNEPMMTYSSLCLNPFAAEDSLNGLY